MLHTTPNDVGTEHSPWLKILKCIKNNVLLASDLVDWSSISESLGSTNSWKGGSVDIFLRSVSPLSGRNLFVRIWDLSFNSFLSECWGSDADVCFANESTNPFFRFFVTWSSPSGVDKRLFSPDPWIIPSVRCSLDKDLGSLKPILGLISPSGWFSLGFLEGSLGTLLDSQLESLKALLGSFKSFGVLSLWSLEGLWSLEKLLLLVLVVVAVVMRVVPLPLEPSCGLNPTN